MQRRLNQIQEERKHSQWRSSFSSLQTVSANEKTIEKHQENWLVEENLIEMNCSYIWVEAIFFRIAGIDDRSSKCKLMYVTMAYEFLRRRKTNGFPMTKLPILCDGFHVRPPSRSIQADWSRSSWKVLKEGKFNCCGLCSPSKPMSFIRTSIRCAEVQANGVFSREDFQI